MSRASVRCRGPATDKSARARGVVARRRPARLVPFQLDRVARPEYPVAGRGARGGPEEGHGRTIARPFATADPRRARHPQGEAAPDLASRAPAPSVPHDRGGAPGAFTARGRQPCRAQLQQRYLWVPRFNQSGFRTFETPNNPRGRIPILRAKQLRELVDVALSSPAEYGLPFTTWSVRTLTEYCTEHHLIPEFSDEWVRRVLRREGLSAQRIRTWKHSDDPLFRPKGDASAPSTSTARRARRSSAWASGARSSVGR